MLHTNVPCQRTEEAGVMNSGDRVRIGTVGYRTAGSPAEATGMARTYFRAMALFWLVFGLITTFAPGLMELFMTEQGKAASTAFSDQVWLHGGLDIISVSILLFVFSILPATKTTLGAAAVVALLPTVAIMDTLVATPYWSAFFLVPAAGTFAFAVWGFMLARIAPRS